MSDNLDGYLKALEKSRKLNSEAEAFADLMIGARRGAGNRGGQGPAGSGARYPIDMGRRAYGVGQGSAAPIPAGPNGNGWDGGAGCLPGTNLPLGAPVGGPCPPEFLCDCDLIGVTTLGTDPIASGTDRLITVTDFDAVALQPVAIWFTAFVATATPGQEANLIANPVIEVPIVIERVDVGQQGQLRTAGVGNALNSAAFAATREPVCIDWAPFRSQNGQELTMDVNNIVDLLPAPGGVHFFAVFWTNVLS